MTAPGIRYEAKPIPARLRALYSDEDADLAFHEIRGLIMKYRRRIQSEPYRLSEKDVILITYGDQVHRRGEATLKTLGTFLDQRLRDVVNSVHILPFYPYSSDDGFSVIDYVRVDPKLGRWHDIEELGRRGYRLMFDAVINHISRHSDWFRRYLDCDPEYEDFFTDVDPSTDLSSVVRPRTSPILSDFTDARGRQRAVWCTFSHDQIDLNYANYRVLLAVLDVLFQYIERGAKLLRLDAIAFVWKELGGPCVHLRQTHELIQLMREVLHQVAPEVIIITETNVPHKENVSYFGNGDDEAQMVYNFALPPLLAYSLLKGDTTTLKHWARSLELPSDKVCFFNFTASHDGVGLRPVQDVLPPEDIHFLVQTATNHGGRVSYRAMSDGSRSPYELNCNYMDLLTHPDVDNEVRAARLLLSQAVTLAMPGVPGVYFHSLVGSRNWTDGVNITGVNRSINRQKLELDLLEAELDDAGHLRHRVFTEYRRLIEIRTAEAAFDPFGPFSFPDAGPGIFAIHQRAQTSSEQIVALHNFQSGPRTATLPDDFPLPAVDLLTGATISERNVELNAYTILWLKHGESP